MEGRELFSGMKVIELASVLAGPSVGQFFAELGADIIKIENPRTKGDVTRSWKLSSEGEEDISAYFSSINWGKRSLSLDIAQSEGVEILYRLVQQSDVVIVSYKPGDAEKLKVDYASLKKIKDDILYGSITGYGNDNPKVGYDAIIQAEAGFMSMNGERGGAPVKMPVALMDILAGHQLKEALLLAYIRRLKTGKGSEVSVSLIEAAVASLANQGTNWLVAGKLPQRAGSAHPNIAPYGDVFTTSDQRQIILAVGTDRQFGSLCEVLGLNLAIDPKYNSNIARVGNRELLNKHLQRSITGLQAEWLVKQLESKHVPVGIIQNVQEALDMTEVKALRLNHEPWRGTKTFAAHFGDGGEKSSHLLPPPHYAAHTVEILSGLGLNAFEIQRLKETGIIDTAGFNQ